MSVTQTSIDSFHQHQAEGKDISQRQQILDFLEQHGGAWTRRQLHELTGIEYGAVCGRVNAMVKDKTLQEIKDTRKNSSGRYGKLVRLPVSEEQMEMFQ
jgi:hypothetical protein